MVKQYGLKEVWIPEDKHIEDEKERDGAKCNIFMSEEFLTPEHGLPKTERKRALILM